MILRYHKESSDGSLKMSDFSCTEAEGQVLPCTDKFIIMHDESPKPSMCCFSAVTFEKWVVQHFTWCKTPKNWLPDFGDCCQKQALCKHLSSVWQVFTTRRCWRNSFLSSLIGCGLVVGDSHWKREFQLFSAVSEPTYFTSDERVLIFSSLLLWDFKFCLIRGLFSLGFLVLLSVAPAHPTHGNKDGGIAALWFPSEFKSA